MNFSERFNARRARKAYDVDIARVLHRGNVTALVECRQAGRYSVLNIRISC